jgi:hypothetical protein
LTRDPANHAGNRRQVGKRQLDLAKVARVSSAFQACAALRDIAQDDVNRPQTVAQPGCALDRDARQSAALFGLRGPATGKDLSDIDRPGEDDPDVIFVFPDHGSCQEFAGTELDLDGLPESSR